MHEKSAKVLLQVILGKPSHGMANLEMEIEIEQGPHFMVLKSEDRRKFLEELAPFLGGAGIASSGLSAGETQATATLENGSALGAQQATSSVIYCFDFGDDFEAPAPGFLRVSRVYRSPKYLWITNVTEVTRIEEKEPLLRDFVQGTSGEFWVGLDNGSYDVTLIFSDSIENHGPFSVYLQDFRCESDITVERGKALKLSFPVNVVEQKLKLRLQAEAGKEFILNGLVIQGPEHKGGRSMFPDAPPDRLPGVDQVLREGNLDCRAALQRCCDWLLGRRLPNGFVGDVARPGVPNSFLWYTAAYPIRAWLAGYSVLRRSVYLDAASLILDKLVDEQLPNGGWEQTFRDKPTERLSSAEINDILKHRWVNTADIGSIVTALAVACHYVARPRKRQYLEAAKRYCDEWASRWRLSSGAFANGLESSVPQTEPYGVATGTQAAAFSTVYAVSHEARYLETAERAANFLLSNWLPDGRVVSYPDPSEGLGRKRIQPVTQFGDVFYYLEGLLFVNGHTRDAGLRAKIQQVFKWIIMGNQGLLQALGRDAWWPLQDTWDNSKSAGMPQVFLTCRKTAQDFGIQRVIGLLQRFLCTPQFARQIGVMVDDPNLPWGGHSLQSWAGCSVAATGFAGLTLAEMIKPGTVYLA